MYYFTNNPGPMPIYYNTPSICTYATTNIYTQGFIINIPNIHGAILQQISFDFVSTDKANTDDLVTLIGFSGQEILLMNAAYAYKTPHYTCSPASAVRGSKETFVMNFRTGDSNDFLTKFGPTISASRYIPVYIGIAVPETWVQSSMISDDRFIVNNIIGTFRY